MRYCMLVLLLMSGCYYYPYLTSRYSGPQYRVIYVYRNPETVSEVPAVLTDEVTYQGSLLESPFKEWLEKNKNRPRVEVRPVIKRDISPPAPVRTRNYPKELEEMVETLNIIKTGRPKKERPATFEERKKMLEKQIRFQTEKDWDVW